MKKIKANKIIIVLILLIALFIILVPYFWMLSNSFKTTKETLTNPTHLLPIDFTLQGYKTVLYDSPFFYWLKNSVIITTTVTVIILFTSSIVGFVFSRYSFKGKKLLYTLLLTTMMVPIQTTIIPQFLLINFLGLMNSLWSLILTTLFSVFGIYLCKQFIDEIPSEMFESAKLDGASDVQVYTKIVIPLIRPCLGALGIFTFLQNWNDYLRPLIFLNYTNKMTLPLAISYFSSIHNTDLSATMAVCSLIMIPVTIVFLLFQKQFVKGIAMTGMK